MVASAVDDKPKIAPGPNPGFLRLGSVRRYQADPIGLLVDIAGTYGGMAQFQLGPLTAYLVSDAEALHQILVTDAAKYYKTARSKVVLGEFLGTGLLLSEGDFWRRQRRLAQPAFHHQRISGYVTSMVELTREFTDSWQIGETRNVAADTMHLALNIVARTLFSLEEQALADEIDRNLKVVQDLGALKIRALFSPRWLPTSNNRRWSTAVGNIRRIGEEIIRKRRANPNEQDNGDLLSMLLLSVDDKGERMNDVEALDEALTLLLAGHDTTALALAWGFYEIATHPEVEAKLCAELDRVLGDRPLTLGDLPNLPYTDMVFKEILRMHPSAWAFLREPVEDVVVQGYQLRKGSTIVISPYTLHRNPAYFPNPEQFDPERFTPENEAKLPRFAYLPFSAGPRVCIGNMFAMMEGRVVLATVFQRWRLNLQAGYTPKPQPEITLHVGGNYLPMQVERRH